MAARLQAYVEIWGGRGPELIPLDGDRVSIGRSQANHVTLSEASVSEMHAALERFPAGWVLRDLGSRNGTFLNGEVVSGDQRLRHGDEIRLGQARVVFRLREAPQLTATATAEGPPGLTRREREVLVALCRPLMGGDVFTEASSVAGMARELVVSEAAIKFHLANLYDKFGIAETDSRRSRLANEAIRRRAVSLGDLRGGGRS